MSQTCLSEVKDLRCIEAVGDLQEGIESIPIICMALLNTLVDQNTGKCFNYDQIRKHIEHAEQCLKSSEKKIKEKLGNLDESMECFLKDKECTEQEKKEKILAMDKLSKDKLCAEEILRQSKRALEQAKINLGSEKEALNKEEAIKNSCESLTIAGSVMLIIPILGWIAGPIMMYEGQCGRLDAINGIMTAEKEIKKAKSELREYEGKVSDYQSRTSEAQKEINKTKEDLKKIQEEIEGLKQDLVDAAEIQNTVRQAVHLLSVLSGRVTVLQMQTQRFILWEPVVNLIKEVMKTAINIAENQFLCSRGLPGLKNTLRENTERLLAICNSPNNSEHESYY
ncbi:myosin-4-like [Triplophysa rosa]|uniref:Uncharacterized protein n=1 Tax=Triplophysa rosa TaxID=992332 RepID=A0A9W7WQ51_TRIRA|nr:myosin-4-like [Triplophysa rosa]KAI7806251.1 hypothetical protein IRJ41_002752 [Triplophysa rosa]